MISGHQHTTTRSAFNLHPVIKLVNLVSTKLTVRATAENAQRESFRVRLMKTKKPDLIEGLACFLDFFTHHKVEFVIGVMILI